MGFPFHSLTVSQTLSKLNTSKKGLTELEVKKRLKKFGPNELKNENKITPLKIFLYQFKNIMVLMLIVASLISFLINEFSDAIVIIIILIINSLLGFFQEYKAEKSMEALKSLVAPKAVVIRDNKEKVVWSRDLVPGDLVVLNVGDVVPANIRLINAVNLKVNQAHLTGESVPVLKKTASLPADTPLTDRFNICFTGSVVSYGKAIGVVTETGMNTEIGLIAQKVSSEGREITPLQKEINVLGKWLAIFAVFAVTIVFIVGLLIGDDLIEVLLISVSLAVSAVPEGLPAVITITLAIGMQRMAAKNAVVRKLSAVQTLGNVTTICSDKTGTLTKNEMTVKKIFDGFNEVIVTGSGYEPIGDFIINGHKVNPLTKPQLNKLLVSGVLCNNSFFGKVDDDYAVIGDPTEGCLLTLAAKAGLWSDELKKSQKELLELSFTSNRKRMSVVYDVNGERIVYSKGAPEVMINLCDRIQKNGRVIKLSKKLRQVIINKNREMASSGLRVLTIAYKPFNSKKINESSVEKNLIFLGLVGMIDPARKEVKDAIALTKKAGIRVMIITGDNVLTAINVARDIGLFTDGSIAFSGNDIDGMSDEEFKEAVSTATIFARVSPEHKFKIVQELKSQGEIVAVTGDGVNDAPALKTAHIGIAMGIKGTDVSKEAAEMILSDDNFSTIVTAIKEGRGIFDNIKKFIKFLLSSNADTISEVLVTMIIGLPLPFLPIHILWMNLVTDGLPALALSVDSKNKGLMNRKPRNPNKSLIRELAIFILIAGFIDAISSIILFYVSLSYEGYFTSFSDIALSKARTMAISSAIFYELFFVFNCRDNDKSVWERSFKENFLSNKFLSAAVIVSFALQLSLIYFPPLQTVFKTTALSLPELGLVLFFASWGLFILPKWFHKDLTIGLKK